MIGKMINTVRKQKGITLAQISKDTGIDIGHLSHIEKGERFPSYKALKAICESLGVSASQFLNYTGKTLSEEQEEYGYVKYIPYNMVPVVEIKEYVYKEGTDKNIMAVVIPDDSMEPNYHKEQKVFVEFFAPINNEEIGLFVYNNTTVLRKFVLTGNKITLKAYNNKYEDIQVKDTDTFNIIGRIVE